MEKLPIFFKNAVFQTFLPTSDWIPCCFGPYTWSRWVYHWWKSILISFTFSKESTFPLCLCQIFFRVPFNSIWAFMSVSGWHCCVGHPLKTPEDHYKLQWWVVLPIWRPMVKSLSLSFVLPVLIFIISCGLRCLNTHFYLSSVSPTTLFYFPQKKYLKHCWRERNSCLLSMGHVLTQWSGI